MRRLRAGKALILTALTVTAAHAAQKAVLWEARRVELRAVREPRPRSPFRFVSEDSAGATTKLMVRDGAGRLWQVKFGQEVKAETFATRLVRALGYYADVTHYVREGRILAVPKLRGLRKYVSESGAFRDARFEYRDPALRFTGDGWSWDGDDNLFAGTRQFNGLKLLMMLLSNWDHKDSGGSKSNNGILERGRGADRTAVYYVTDWGSSMGKWGPKFIHNKWDCEGYGRQSWEFVRKAGSGKIVFGFSSGRNPEAIRRDIGAADIRWFLGLFDGISDADLRAALKDSGATPHEQEHFLRALRTRLGELRHAALMMETPVESTRLD